MVRSPPRLHRVAAPARTSAELPRHPRLVRVARPRQPWSFLDDDDDDDNDVTLTLQPHALHTFITHVGQSAAWWWRRVPAARCVHFFPGARTSPVVATSGVVLCPCSFLLATVSLQVRQKHDAETGVSKQLIGQRKTGAMYIQCIVTKLGGGSFEEWIEQATKAGPEALASAIDSVFEEWQRMVKVGESWTLPAGSYAGTTRAICASHLDEALHAFRAAANAVKSPGLYATDGSNSGS